MTSAQDAEHDHQETEVSKSQKKRDMQALRDLGAELVGLATAEVAKIRNDRVREAALECQRITKGNAHKRQLQFLAKLLRSEGQDEVTHLVESFDASKRTYQATFDRLERWRAELISDFATGFSEVVEQHPDVDRQQLRTLVRQAREEQAGDTSEASANAGAGKQHYRRLFQFLKNLEIE